MRASVLCSGYSGGLDTARKAQVQTRVAHTCIKRSLPKNQIPTPWLSLRIAMKLRFGEAKM